MTAGAHSPFSPRAHDGATPRPPTRPLGGSFSLVRIAGIDIRVHFTFFILLTWIALSYLLSGKGWPAAAVGILLICGVFATIVLHELGHALVARRFGLRTQDITLLPIGGVGRLEHMPERPRQELAIALAGPAVNVVLALALLAVLAVLGQPLGAPATWANEGPLLAKLVWVNLGLAVFNLLPAFPMDGGRVLRAALAMRIDRTRATAIAARLGRAAAVLFGILGLYRNPILLLIALFIWFGAEQEYALVRLAATLRDVPIERVMITDFATLRGDETLGAAAQRMLGGFQAVFPVVEGGTPIGMVSHDRLLGGIASLGPAAPVARAMNRQLRTVERDQMADRAIEAMGGMGDPIIVMDGPRIAGLVLPAHLTELSMLLEKEPARRGPVAYRRLP